MSTTKESKTSKNEKLVQSDTFQKFEENLRLLDKFIRESYEKSGYLNSEEYKKSVEQELIHSEVYSQQKL